jgi:O-antigen ligase/tetratricopeptide (TPR) repeat protein
MSGDSDAQLTRSERLGLLAFLAALAAVTVLQPSAARLYVWPWRGLALVLWWVPCVLVLSQALRGREWFLPGPLLTLGCALLAATVVSAAALGPYPALSLPQVWPTLGGVALLFWLTDHLARHSRRVHLVASVLAGAAAALAVISLLQWGSGDAPWAGRNEAPFGHSIYTAGALVLLLPWAGWAAWQASGLARVAWLVAVALGAIALVSTSSRGGILALVAAVTIAAGWMVLRSGWPRSRKILTIAAAIVVGIAGIASNARLRDLALSGGWSESARESNVQRTAMLEAGLELGRQRPLLGWGPGTIPVGYPQVRAKLSGGVDNVLQLHNTPLQLWATLGGAGVFAAGLIGVGLLSALYRALSRRYERERGEDLPFAHVRGQPTSSPGMAAAVSTLGYWLFSLTDHQLDVPLMNFTAVANVAILAVAAIRVVAGVADPGPMVVESPPSGADRGQRPQLQGNSTESPRPRLRSLRAALVALLFVLAAAPLWPTLRDLFSRRAYAADDLEGAIAWMPADPYYRHQLAARFVNEREGSSDAAERHRLTQAAVETLRDSLTTRAHTEYAHFNLGWLLLELGQPAEAATQFRTAAHLAPMRGGVYLGFGFALLQLDQEPAAIRAFALETLVDPRAITAPLWDEGGPLASLRPRILGELAEIAATTSLAQRIAWARWWAADPAEQRVPEGFSDASRAFVSAAPEIAAGRVVPGTTYAWTRLYHAWRDNAWDRLTRDEAYAAALRRRAARHRGDFLAFLRAGTENEPAFSRVLRRIRPGYGVVTFHPDGAPPADVLLVPENRILAEFAHELFPAKGDLPARVVLQLLPKNP